ncbi:hypothetical protein HPB48_021262 [Haemaphysalis longicornis]|uniref:BPTI/Kunitz inhibitor domain-containing protein n=1 Tax=Haemaphysalis longicornis TaxID=44386 RepID=A0A9J6GT39_HAELO|nr:hypothetical protein HPB48_021262 [Haemaphysalis longicornis]
MRRPPPPRSVRDVATGMETSPLESRKWDKHLALVPAVAVLAALLIVLTLGTVATIKSVASNPVDKRIPDGESGLALPKPFGPEAPPPGPPLLPDAPSMPDEAVTSGTNTDTEEKAVVSGVDFSSDLDVMRIPFRRPAKPECGAVLYTYCSEAHREFHYRASLNACVSSEPGAVLQLCSRGSNRFASLRDCEGSCVHAQPPLEACLEKTLFTTCRRQDVNSGSWWWFDGKACLAWDFPEGGCPDNGSAVFTTAELCMSRCTNPRYPPCTAPRAVPCPSGQLKFPYFAVGCPIGRTTGVWAPLRSAVGERCHQPTLPHRRQSVSV